MFLCPLTLLCRLLRELGYQQLPELLSQAVSAIELETIPTKGYEGLNQVRY